MLNISPKVISAFEAESERRDLAGFVAWWNARTAVLAIPIDLASAPEILRAAGEAGARIGLYDNADNRIFLQAAAIRLMPQPTGEQWLLTADAIFFPASDDERLGTIAVIARGEG